MKHHYDKITSDFTCKHCHNYVSTDPFFSGVNNRNHCPYCLWSRHMDMFEPGDRMAACKAAMQPVGLTLKRTNKKYGSQQGELMIIHQCVECERISINRIAADDDNENLLAVFENTCHLDGATQSRITMNGIHALTEEDSALVRARLFGWSECPSPAYATAG